MQVLQASSQPGDAKRPGAAAPKSVLYAPYHGVLQSIIFQILYPRPRRTTAPCSHRSATGSKPITTPILQITRILSGKSCVSQNPKNETQQSLVYHR